MESQCYRGIFLHLQMQPPLLAGKQKYHICDFVSFHGFHKFDTILSSYAPPGLLCLPHMYLTHHIYNIHAHIPTQQEDQI